MKMHEIFDDAHRRICIAKQRNEFKKSDMWIGLAVPSHMKAAKNKGWIKTVNRETPRVLNWYRFTESGWMEYEKRFANAPDYFDSEFPSFVQNNS